MLMLVLMRPVSILLCLSNPASLLEQVNKEEEEFEKQYQDWLTQYNTWKEQNKGAAQHLFDPCLNIVRCCCSCRHITEHRKNVMFYCIIVNIRPFWSQFTISCSVFNNFSTFALSSIL